MWKSGEGFVNKFALVCIGLCLFGLGACQGGEIFRRVNIDNGRGVSIDARQRLVFVTEKGGRTGSQRIVCAEPSPDVAVAAAESLAANLSSPTSIFGGGENETLAAGIAQARSESVASIAFRTQTIQLLRDALYRACEAYMNGAINDFQYQVIIANMDRLMPALIAADGLTFTQAAAAIGAAATAPPVSVSPTEGPAVTASGQEGEGGVQPIVIDTSNPTYVAANPQTAKSVRDIVAIMNDRTSVPVLCMSLHSDAVWERFPEHVPSHSLPGLTPELREFCNHVFRAAAGSNGGGAYTDKIDFRDTPRSSGAPPS